MDQVIFVLQAGPNRHEHICESLELFARRVMPEFSRAASSASGPRPSDSRRRSSAALARREPAARGAARLRDRRAGGARAGRSSARAARLGRRRPSLREEARAARARRPAGDGAAGPRRQRRPARAALRQRAGPARDLHRHGAGSSSPSSPSGSRATSPTSWPTTATARRPSRWTVRVRDGAAAVVPGHRGTPAITFKLSVPDFARTDRRGGRAAGAALLGPLRRRGRPGAGHPRAGDVRRAAAVLAVAEPDRRVVPAPRS